MKKLSLVLFILGMALVFLSNFLYRNEINKNLSKMETELKEIKMRTEIKLESEKQNLISPSVDEGKNDEKKIAENKDEDKTIKSDAKSEQTKPLEEQPPKKEDLEDNEEAKSEPSEKKTVSETEQTESEEKPSAKKENPADEIEVEPDKKASSEKSEPLTEKSGNTISFTIKMGMNSEQIARLLALEGICSREEFLEKVKSGKVSKKLIYGTYTIPKDLTVDELVDNLSNKNSPFRTY